MEWVKPIIIFMRYLYYLINIIIISYYYYLFVIVFSLCNIIRQTKRWKNIREKRKRHTRICSRWVDHRNFISSRGSSISLSHNTYMYGYVSGGRVRNNSFIWIIYAHTKRTIPRLFVKHFLINNRFYQCCMIIGIYFKKFI